MTTLTQLAIVLVSADRRQLRHWAAALTPVAAHLWQSIQEVPRDESLAARPLIIVTDGLEDFARDPRFAFLANTEFGVVRLGSGDSGDLAQALDRLAASTPARSSSEVELPVDVSARELALVCRLLGEIVMLRRAVYAGDRERNRLAEQALRDPLTELPNRRAWDDELAKRLSSSLQAHELFVVAIFDLDHFKRVNDHGGHLLGDEVLRAAGRAIDDSIRPHDFAARLGGDEFGVILAELESGAAAHVIARIRQEISRTTSEVAASPITASAGYSLITAEFADHANRDAPSTAFAAADAALRQAKQAGRNREIVASLAEP